MEDKKMKKIKELFNAAMELNGFEKNPKPCVFLNVSPHVAWITVDYYFNGWEDYSKPDRQGIIFYNNNSCIKSIEQEIFFIKTLKRREENAY